MTENWELGLSKVRGKYISVMGDDDGLLPESLSDCFHLIEKYDVEIVSWYRWPYFWPNAPQQRNSLYIPLFDKLELIDGRVTLNRAYECLITYEYLPTLYNSFVSRDLLEKAKAKNNGKLYSNNCFSPDVFSGLVNSFFCNKILWKNQPFSMSGISSSSNFASLTISDSQPAKYWRLEESKKQIHPYLKSANDVDLASHMATISDFLWAKDTFFKKINGINLDLARAIQIYLLDRANDDPSRYEKYLGWATDLIHHFGFKMENFKVSPKLQNRASLDVPGRFLGDPRSPHGLVLHCSSLGVHDINSAVNLCHAVMKGKIPHTNDKGQPAVDPIQAFNLISGLHRRLSSSIPRSKVTYF
jgi:hypothetical protein